MPSRPAALKTSLRTGLGHLLISCDCCSSVASFDGRAIVSRAFSMSWHIFLLVDALIFAADFL